MPSVERDDFSVGGLRTSYLSAGQRTAPAVVLLHDGAWGGSAHASWAEVIPVLAKQYRVIAPDLYGYGRSSKMVQLDVAPYEFRLRQVGALLDALGLGTDACHIVGNSFGGAMALRAATSPWFSWRMKSAVSISGTGGPYRTRDSLVSLSHFDGTREDMLRIVRLLTGDFDGIDGYVELRLRDASNAGHFRAVAAAGLSTPFESSASSQDEYPDNLRDVRMPVVLVSGTDDTLVDPDWATKIASHGPSCTVLELAGKHSPNISDPETTAELLIEILNTCEHRAHER